MIAMDPVRIWVAIALGTALATVARREGQRLIARTDAQWLAPYRRLYDHRVDCFLLGILAGTVSAAPLGGVPSPHFGVWAGLFLGFAAFSAANGDIETNTRSAWYRFVTKLWRLAIGPAAMVAGWLCAETITIALER